MAYAGAAGDTATQMASTCRHFDDLSPARLNVAFDAIDLALASRTVTAAGTPGIQFYAADSIWGDTSEVFQQPFLDTLATDYGAAVQTSNT